MCVCAWVQFPFEDPCGKVLLTHTLTSEVTCNSWAWLWSIHPVCLQCARSVPAVCPQCACSKQDARLCGFPAPTPAMQCALHNPAQFESATSSRRVPYHVNPPSWHELCSFTSGAVCLNLSQRSRSQRARMLHPAPPCQLRTPLSQRTRSSFRTR